MPDLISTDVKQLNLGIVLKRSFFENTTFSEYQSEKANIVIEDTKKQAMDAASTPLIGIKV